MTRPLRALVACETSGAVRKAATQLSLFAWADPPPPKPAPRGGCGFTVWHPCACGSTHSMLYVTDPYNVLALRWWKISRHSPHTLEMMTERLIAWGLMPATPPVSRRRWPINGAATSNPPSPRKGNPQNENPRQKRGVDLLFRCNDASGQLADFECGDYLR